MSNIGCVVNALTGHVIPVPLDTVKVVERAVQKVFLTVALKADHWAVLMVWLLVDGMAVSRVDVMVVSWDVTWDDMRAAPLVDVMVWMLVGVLVASKDTQKADW